MDIKAIDWQMTVERLNGNIEAAREVLALFLKELPELQKMINDAYQSNQIELLYEHLHRLHGGCCYVGVPTLKISTYQFCEAAKKKRVSELSALLMAFNEAANAVNHAAKGMVF